MQARKGVPLADMSHAGKMDFGWRSGDRCAEKGSRNHKIVRGGRITCISEVDYDPCQLFHSLPTLRTTISSLGNLRSIGFGGLSSVLKASTCMCFGGTNSVQVAVSWFHLYLLHSSDNFFMHFFDSLYTALLRSFCAL